MERKYPEGSSEVTEFIPLTAEEQDQAMARVNTDFNPAEYAALQQYRNTHM